MTYITNTITNANPGPTLYSAIETAMLAQGWTLVDTVTIGSNTHKVLKSAGASGGNTYGLDWYLDINYPTTGTTGGIRFCPFESYDAVNHLGIRGPYSANSITIDATTFSRYGATGYALETNWANSASYAQLSTALTTAAFTYRISVTRNRIVGLLDNVPGAFFYAGFFTPSSAFSSNAGSALFPLVQAIVTPTGGAQSGTTSSNACLTRLPNLATMTNSGWSYHVTIPNPSINSSGFPEGQIGVAASPFTGRSTGAPLIVAANAGGANASTPSNATPLVDNIGTIDDIIGAYVNTGSVRGDSMTVGSDTWYDCAPSSAFTLFFRGV